MRPVRVPLLCEPSGAALLAAGCDGASAGAPEYDVLHEADLGRILRHPLGIEQVVVNGALVVRDGALTDARPGKVLRRTGGTS